jgi:hypothetical protein
MFDFRHTARSATLTAIASDVPVAATGLRLDEAIAAAAGQMKLVLGHLQRVQSAKLEFK